MKIHSEKNIPPENPLARRQFLKSFATGIGGIVLSVPTMAFENRMAPNADQIRRVCVRTENTHFHPSAYGRMVEVGAVELVGTRFTGRMLHAFLDPEIEVSWPMQEEHGLNLALLTGRPRFADLANTLLAFVAGAEFITMNDICRGYLENELSRCGLPVISAICPKAIETFGMFRQRFPGYPFDGARNAVIRKEMRALHGFNDIAPKTQRCTERAYFVAKAYQWMTSHPARFDHPASTIHVPARVDR